MSPVDDMFAFAAQQQTEAYNRIAAYKEKQAAHELLTAQLLHENATLCVKHAQQMLRPSILLKPSLAQDQQGGWVASYGECHGQGPTPDLACQALDAAWVGKQE